VVPSSTVPRICFAGYVPIRYSYLLATHGHASCIACKSQPLTCLQYDVIGSSNQPRNPAVVGTIPRRNCKYQHCTWLPSVARGCAEDSSATAVQTLCTICTLHDHDWVRASIPSAVSMISGTAMATQPGNDASMMPQEGRFRSVVTGGQHILELLHGFTL
jgi:hypothetical protein